MQRIVDLLLSVAFPLFIKIGKTKDPGNIITSPNITYILHEVIVVRKLPHVMIFHKCQRTTYSL